MKIIRKRLNSIFDQYSNQENRLTHALLQTIGSSEWLLSTFLREMFRINDFSGFFEISTQKVPLAQGDKEPKDIQSIPDAWIINEKQSLGIAIEVKNKKKSLRADQLYKHAKRICAYKSRYLLVISPDLEQPPLLSKPIALNRMNVRLVWQSWDKIYIWARKLEVRRAIKDKRDKFLVSSFRDYLERRREILGFQGIFFIDHFDVEQAKQILSAEMEEVKSHVGKIYKILVRRRPGITTFSQEGVWDCFGTKEGFTKDLHLTISIHEKYQDISLTIPNASISAWARLKEVFSDKNLLRELLQILKRLRKRIPHLYLEFIQRHFIAQRIGIRDGFMEFDIDTLGAPFKKRASGVREFQMWKAAIGEAVLNKKGVNGQVMFKVRYYFSETKDIHNPSFIKTAKHTIEALKPLYDFLRGSKPKR